MPFPPEDPRFLQIQRNIDYAVSLIFEKLLLAISEDRPVQEVLAESLAAYNAEVGVIIGTALGERLAGFVGTLDLRDYVVDGFPLSDRLYRKSVDVSRAARQVVAKHAKGLHSAQKLTLELFEGYRFDQPRAILDIQAKLPKYLRKPFANIKIARLRTPALRAAYQKVINHQLELASEAAMERALRVAWDEQGRYFAARIARTELARIVNTQDGEEIMADPELRVVEIRLSQAHPKVDICDAHARADKYGLGPGMYPKAKAPRPPFHPHCYCQIVRRYDLDGGQARERPGAYRSFLRSLPAKERALVVGSYDKAAEVLSGKDLVGVIDRGKRPAFKTKTLSGRPAFVIKK